MSAAARIVQFVEKCPPMGLQIGPTTFSPEYVTEIAAAQKRIAISYATMGATVVLKEILDGLQAIVDRADNGELGTSKVQDMKRLAASLLAQHGGAA